MARELWMSGLGFNYPKPCPACGGTVFSIYHDPETKFMEDTAECEACKFTFSRGVPHICPRCSKVWECDAGTCQHTDEVREAKDRFMGSLRAEFDQRGIKEVDTTSNLPLSPREILEGGDEYCPACETEFVKEMLSHLPS